MLIHGGDGVDLTLAVTSLTQIILNPDCRSIRGFEVHKVAFKMCIGFIIAILHVCGRH